MAEMSNEELAKRYGPFREIWREREQVLLSSPDGYLHILTVTSDDVAYEDLPEDDRPSDEELEDRGETREDFMGSMLFATVGHHRVNVEVIYESARPMPADLVIENFYFDEFIEAP
jgi:hypothetical protein